MDMEVEASDFSAKDDITKKRKRSKIGETDSEEEMDLQEAIKNLKQELQNLQEELSNQKKGMQEMRNAIGFLYSSYTAIKNWFKIGKN